MSKKENIVRARTITIFIVTICIFISLVRYLVIDISQEKQDKIDRCNTYCDCLTQDCPYTFDYDDVKDCDCTGEKVSND